MANGVEASIFTALHEHLSSLTLSPAMPIAWPNVDYTPGDDGYLRVDHLPNTTAQATLGTTGKNRHRGIFQIAVHWPKGQGRTKPTDAADSIIAWFKRGTSLTENGVIVRVDAPPSLGPSMVDGEFFMMPISVPYTAEANNPT